jgi:hypothetical protein
MDNRHKNAPQNTPKKTRAQKRSQHAHTSMEEQKKEKQYTKVPKLVLFRALALFSLKPMQICVCVCVFV